VQTEIKPINEVCSEVTVVIEAEKVDEAYKKYFNKKAQELEIPGFRKGKAPKNMIEKLHGADIKEDFEIKFAIDSLYQVLRENNLNFLATPQLKSLNWNQGSDMKLTVILEHIPDLTLDLLENLEVPFKPQTLEDAVNQFLSDLRWKQRTIQDVDTVEENTTLHSRLYFTWKGEDYNYSVNIYSEELENVPALKELVSKK